MERGKERQIVGREQGQRSGTNSADYRITVLGKQLDTVIEKIDVLNGDRKRALAKAAVKRGDAKAPSLLAKPIEDGSAPSAQQYNALIKDMQAIVRAIGRLSGE